MTLSRFAHQIAPLLGTCVVAVSCTLPFPETDMGAGMLAVDVVLHETLTPYLAAAQALDFREFGFGKGTRAGHAAVREVVEHLDVDRPLFTDHNNMADAVQRCTMLDAVESEVGELESSW